LLHAKQHSAVGTYNPHKSGLLRHAMQTYWVGN